MKWRVFRVCLLLGLGASACTTSPTSPAGAITVTTAAQISPANGAFFANLAQPVTLTINNAIVTDATTAVIYTFEVATDAGFANKVATKDVPQTPGQTSLTLAPLTAGKDYYWHVRTTGGDTVGTFTSPIKFSIGPAIVLAPPAPLTPVNGAMTSAWPMLTVTNSLHTGPVGTVIYQFEVSTSSSFSSTLATGSASEGSNQTSFAIPSNLTPPTQATQYFWRVTATDQSSGISSQSSITQSFTFEAPKTPQAKLAAQLGLVLWPGIQPTGTNGHAVLGDNWDVQTLVSFGGTRFVSPLLEWLQLFDLMDRGFDPQGAIDWMHGHGYPTEAAWFDRVQVIGVQYVYLALIQGKWDVVLRAE